MAGRPPGRVVELPRQRADPVGAGEPFGRHMRDDHRVRPDRLGAAERGVGLVTERPRVHAADSQPGGVEIGPQAVRVGDHVERLDRPVAEPGDAPQHAGPVVRQFVPDRIQLHRQRITHASPSRPQAFLLRSCGAARSHDSRPGQL